MRTHLENLDEEVASKRRSLEKGEIPPDKIMEVKAELEREEKRVSDIKESRPKLTEEEEKRVDEAHKYLGTAVSEALFTRSEMKLGLADAHKEADRISKPCIKIPDNMVEMCRDNNIDVYGKEKNYHLTRKGAELMYKYCGMYNGGNTNTEWLRKDKSTARTQTVRPKYLELVD